MISSLRDGGRGLALLVSALLVALSVVVPVLDRDRPGRILTLESEHDPATCVTGHDHTVCTQVGASQALPDDGPRQPRRPASTALLRTTTHDDAAPPHATDSSRPRAPPPA